MRPSLSRSLLRMCPCLSILRCCLPHTRRRRWMIPILSVSSCHALELARRTHCPPHTRSLPTINTNQPPQSAHSALPHRHSPMPPLHLPHSHSVIHCHIRTSTATPAASTHSILPHTHQTWLRYNSNNSSNSSNSNSDSNKCSSINCSTSNSNNTRQGSRCCTSHSYSRTAFVTPTLSLIPSNSSREWQVRVSQAARTLSCLLSLLLSRAVPLLPLLLPLPLLFQLHIPAAANSFTRRTVATFSRCGRQSAYQRSSSSSSFILTSCTTISSSHSSRSIGGKSCITFTS